MSTPTLELKITAAEKKSEKLYKSDMTWQEEVDSLLDRMNAIGKLLANLQSLLINLTFEIERDFEGFKNSDIAPEGVKRVSTITSKLLILVRKSDLYPGVKSVYSLVKQENSYLKELLEDRNIGLDFGNDAEMSRIANDSIKTSDKFHKKS